MPHQSNSVNKKDNVGWIISVVYHVFAISFIQSVSSKHSGQKQHWIFENCMKIISYNFSGQEYVSATSLVGSWFAIYCFYMCSEEQSSVKYCI